MRVLVLNGPNLRRLGRREPSVYGTATYADLVAACERTAEELGLDVEVRQTDDEATMIGWLHEAADAGVAVVLNPAAWTHYSYAVRDAAAQVGAPLLEVHLSQPAAREDFRHHSVVGPVATGTISGLGLDSYRLALRAVAARRPHPDAGGPGPPAPPGARWRPPPGPAAWAHHRRRSVGRSVHSGRSVSTAQCRGRTTVK